MKNSFLDIIRTPDDIKVYTETSPFRFEEPGPHCCCYAYV